MTVGSMAKEENLSHGSIIINQIGDGRKGLGKNMLTNFLIFPVRESVDAIQCWKGLLKNNSNFVLKILHKYCLNLI